jgi:hypothetical protein
MSDLLMSLTLVSTSVGIAAVVGTLVWWRSGHNHIIGNPEVDGLRVAIFI